MTSAGAEYLWGVLPIYAFGYALAVEAAHRSKKVQGHSLMTELEWQLNGPLNFLFLLQTVWFFVRLMEQTAWWIALPTLIVSVQLGIVVVYFAHRLLGILRGLLFALSPISLVCTSYVLWKY